MERKQNSTAPSPEQPLSGEGVRRISRLNIVKSHLRLATWNVRSLFAAGKLNNTIKEAQRLNIYILGISELRWPGSGTSKNEHDTLYYSGSAPVDRYHRNGVGIFVSAAYNKYVTDRIMLLQLQGQPFNINVVQVYAPTAERQYDGEVEELYDLVNRVLSKLNKDEVTLIIGDFNAKIGQGRRADLVGDFGIGSNKARGDRLFEFHQEKEMVVMNTWFKLPKRRLYTWISPQEPLE